MQKIKLNDLTLLHEALKEGFLEDFHFCLNNSAFVGQKGVQPFERKFADYIGSKFAVGVNSGTDALFLALRALDIGAGDRVITVANTFTSTVSAICATGAIPVFVDVDANTGLMSHEELIKYFKYKPKDENVKAIIPVHLWGQCADMHNIAGVAEENDVSIIEDACQAHGAFSNNKRAGSLGTMGCFSFYPGKNLGALGDGGIITTDSQELYERLLSLRNCGRSDKNIYEYDRVGYVSRLDVLQAKFLERKIECLDNWNTSRRSIARKYILEIDKMMGIEHMFNSNIEDCVFHQFVVKTSNREELINVLNEYNIEWGIHYPIPLHLEECYKHLDYRRGDLRNSERLSEEILSIPIHPHLKKSEIDRVIEALSHFSQLLNDDAYGHTYRRVIQ